MNCIHCENWGCRRCRDIVLVARGEAPAVAHTEPLCRFCGQPCDPKACVVSVDGGASHGECYQAWVRTVPAQLGALHR